MKNKFEKFLLTFFLVFSSFVLYYFHFLIFKDIKHIFIYLIGDIAFLPIYILLVSLVFNKLLELREKKNTFRKLNMIIGVFFSEFGKELVKSLSERDNNFSQIKDLFNDKINFETKNFKTTLLKIKKYQGSLTINSDDLTYLKDILTNNEEILLNIIKTPVLLEHELFSELLMATFHLEEELKYRKKLNNLGKEDKAHIVLDINRVYSLILLQFAIYIEHLKNHYPYLYSFTLRTNPFDSNAKVEID